MRSSGRANPKLLAPGTGDPPAILPGRVRFNACCWCAGSCDTSPAHKSSIFSGGPLGLLNSPPRFSSSLAADSSVQVAGSGVGGVGVCDALGDGSLLELGAGRVQNIVRTPPDSPMMTAGAPRHWVCTPRTPALGSIGCGGKRPPISSGLTPLMQD